MRLPDFEKAAAGFRQRGWLAESLGEAIWRYRPRDGAWFKLLLTAGIHGDETAPIEMLCGRLEAWARDAASLSVDLVVALGNLEAISAGKRYMRHDMNRMFGAQGVPGVWGDEGQRAELLSRTITSVLREPQASLNVHLDLHTTIRPSLKPTFAIVPSDDLQSPLVRWLGHAGLDATVLNPGPGSTLSALSARQGALACTVELGQARPFGANDFGPLARFSDALDEAVRRPASWAEAHHSAMETYRVTRELVRHSEDFELMVPASAPNFTRLSPGQLVSRDRDVQVHARYPGECVLFPNPSVAVGLRAGLLVAPTEAHRP